jgi:hypothetical protein
VVYSLLHHHLLLYQFQDLVVGVMVLKELRVFKVLKEDRDNKVD